MQEKENKVVYRKVDFCDNLCIRTISDGSYYQDKLSVGGIIAFLASTQSTHVSPIYWKSRTINQVCVSTKDAEMRAIFSGVTHGLHAANTIEIMLFGNFHDGI